MNRREARTPWQSRVRTSAVAVCVWLVVSIVFGWGSRAFAQDSQPLTLKDAVALALKNSRELALSRVQYTVAQNEARLAHSAFLPNIFTGAGYVYSNGFPATPGGSAPSIVKVVYTENVYNPELHGEQRADEDRARNEQLEIERVRDSVIVRTASTYLELAKVRHGLELLGAEEASAQKILDYTRERAGAGLELPIEVTRGELTEAKINYHILQLNDRNDILTEQLRGQLGYPDSAAIEVSPEDLPATAEESAAALENVALENSIDLKEQENERSARQHLFTGAKHAYWPTVQFIGEYDLLSEINHYSEFFRGFKPNNFNVGVEITIPLFAAKTAATVALAKSELRAQELSVGGKRNDVRLDVRQKARDAHELEAAREVARLDLKLSQETLAELQERFDQGRASLRDLEQVRVEESEKWVTFLDADFARQKGQLSLLQTTGQLAKVFQ
jgi:outer membrane protein TolC